MRLEREGDGDGREESDSVRRGLEGGDGLGDGGGGGGVLRRGLLGEEWEKKRERNFQD